MTKSSELRRPLTALSEKVDALTVRTGKKSKARRRQKKMIAGARATANEARDTVMDRYQDLGKQLKRFRKQDTASARPRRAAAVGVAVVAAALAAMLINLVTRRRHQQGQQPEWHQ
jgi:hypothetical protein